MPIRSSKYSYIVALLLAAFACAEPIGVDIPNKGKGTKPSTSSNSGGSTQKSTADTSSSGGSTEGESTPADDGGAKATSVKATTATKGGSTGISRTTTAPKATGGTDSTADTEPTGTGGGAEVTTTTPEATGSCATSTEQVKVVATWTKSASSGSTTITPAAGATVAAAGMGVKFCFTISSKLTPAAIVISHGSISLKREPYNVVITGAAITLEDGPDGGSCMVIDVGGVTAAKDITLDGEAKMQLDWRFDYAVVGASQPDPTKPAQFIVTVGSDVAGCGDVPLT